MRDNYLISKVTLNYYNNYYLSSDEEEIEDILGFNPWTNVISPIYQLEEKEPEETEPEEINNPVIFLAQSENVILQEQSEAHVGPLENHQQLQFQQMLENNIDICAKSQTDIGKTNLIQHKIITHEATPITQSPYRCNMKNRTFLQEEITKMKPQGFTQKSISPWAAPIVIVEKKGGDKRFCIDYRKLNNVIKMDAYPLPRIDNLLESIRTSNWFTTLDLASGYWQVTVHPDDREKTAFITPFGLYEFHVMPFGLCNASATFQRLMNYALQEFLGKFVLVYLDDIIIYSKTFEQHLDHVQQVFTALRNANLKIKLKKCFFCFSNIAFFKHIVGKNGIKPDPTKIEKVKNFPIPTDLTSTRAALELFSYYRKFIKDFSKIAKPITQLLRKDESFQWGEKQQRAFEFLKEILIQAPIFHYPDFDKSFILYTDASGTGLGAVLSQKREDGNECVIAYASRSLNRAEQNYSITDWYMQREICSQCGFPSSQVKRLEEVNNTGNAPRYCEICYRYQYYLYQAEVYNVDMEQVEREHHSQLVTQQEIHNICENCNVKTKLNCIWEIFHGYNSYCSLVGDKCHDSGDHHTHNICDDCLNKTMAKENQKYIKEKHEQDKRNAFLDRAKNYAYTLIDRDQESYIIRRNTAILFQYHLNDSRYPRYKNFCENCGGLLNSRKSNWLIFAYPPKYHYNRNEILTCKTCFAFLAEKCFFEKEIELPPQYPSDLDENDMDFNYLSNEVFWDEPQEVRCKNKGKEKENLLMKNVQQLQQINNNWINAMNGETSTRIAFNYSTEKLYTGRRFPVFHY